MEEPPTPTDEATTAGDGQAASAEDQAAALVRRRTLRRHASLQNLWFFFFCPKYDMIVIDSTRMITGPSKHKGWELWEIGLFGGSDTFRNTIVTNWRNPTDSLLSVTHYDLVVMKIYLRSFL